MLNPAQRSTRKKLSAVSTRTRTVHASPSCSVVLQLHKGDVHNQSRKTLANVMRRVEHAKEKEKNVNPQLTGMHNKAPI